MSFILRKTNGKGVDAYWYLGKSFNIINESCAPEEFNKTLEEQFEGVNRDITTGYVIYNHGADIIPLFSTQESCILSHEGTQVL